MGVNLKWAGYSLDLEQRTCVMGVLNVTPDSFSDGGCYFDFDRAVERGLTMAREGADIIDVGGESSRPYSPRLSGREEKERVIPVIKTLASELGIPISIDTYKSDVAAEALKVGASIINDISALRFDPRMGPLAAEAEAPVVLMHMKGTPEHMQDRPTYRDLIAEIVAFLREAVDRAVSAGIREELTIVDPGIGFGKTFDHNLEIIRALPQIASIGRPVLLGTSNKAFIGHILGKKADERETGTLATVAAGVMYGAHIVRVHAVQKAVETVKIVDAIKRGAVRQRARG
jgi:dihydropteroate synthase